MKRWNTMTIILIIKNLIKTGEIMDINIYCDESCHLNYKNENVMGFAGISCPNSKIKDVNSNIKEIKVNHGVSPYQELKWSKISKSNLQLYKEVIKYFFIDDDLSFRTIIIINKDKLKFTPNNTKADFYYKMLYLMIIKILNPENQYKIFLDIKDTISSKKIKNLRKFLNSTKIDYNYKKIITDIQTIRSYESNILQLTDILLGALTHYHKKKFNSPAKQELINYIKEKSHKTLDSSTLINEPKFNIFISNAEKMKLRGEDDLF